jgi:hypothetical protein
MGDPPLDQPEPGPPVTTRDHSRDGQGQSVYNEDVMSEVLREVTKTNGEVETIKETLKGMQSQLVKLDYDHRSAMSEVLEKIADVFVKLEAIDGRNLPNQFSQFRNVDRRDNRQNYHEQTLDQAEFPTLGGQIPQIVMTEPADDRDYANVAGTQRDINDANKAPYQTVDRRQRQRQTYLVRDGRTDTSGGRRNDGMTNTERRHFDDMIHNGQIQSRDRSVSRSSQVEKHRKDPIETILSKGSRTIGFKPITDARLNRFAGKIREENRDQTEEVIMTKAKQMAVKEFMRGLMGINDETYDDLNIEEVFTSKNGKMKETVYLRLKDKKSVAIIYSHAKYMDKDDPQKPSLEMYVPYQAFDRYKAIGNLAYQARQNDKTTKTDIRIGNKDFIYRQKQRGDNRPWGDIEPEVIPEDFPKIVITPLINQLRKVTLRGRDPEPALEEDQVPLVPIVPVVMTLTYDNDNDVDDEGTNDGYSDANDETEQEINDREINERSVEMENADENEADQTESYAIRQRPGRSKGKNVSKQVSKIPEARVMLMVDNINGSGKKDMEKSNKALKEGAKPTGKNKSKPNANKNADK